MIFIGTSGWQYRDWRGPFYPQELPQREWLGYYAQRFTTVEIDNAFYRLPERQTFERWREATPEGFRAAVKMSRFLTHVKRLREPAEPVARFLSQYAGLADRGGPVLLQLPPNLRFDAGLLSEALRPFPPQLPVAVEPRHESWWSDQARKTLQRHAAALCWADRLGRPATPLWRTADFGYLRLHQGAGRPTPRYGRTALRSWLERIASAFPADRDVDVYFNNDPGGAAVLDAQALSRQAAGMGVTLAATRA